MAIDQEKVKAAWLKFRDNIYSFANFFFPHWMTSPSGEFQKQICQDLSDRHSFYALEVFRGGAKTTYVSMIKSIHFALFDKIGDITLTSLSEEFILNEVMRKIKFEFDTNEKLITYFGNLKTSKWSESYFVLKNGIAFEGTGISGQLRGGRRGLIIGDDLEDEETASSEEQREKLRKRIGKELIPKLLPKAQMILAGTPIHQMAYIQQIITTPDNGWFKRIYPAYHDGMQAEGKEMWPQMYPHARLQQIKLAMGSNYFSAEYLCNPISDESSPIKESQIRYWKELPKQYSCVIAVDPAYSDDASADYKVAALVAIDPMLNRYLIQYVRTHDGLGSFEDAIINLYLNYRPFITQVGIPSGGTERGFFDGFGKKCMMRGINSIPVVELKNTFTNSATSISSRNKKSRIIAALQPWFEQGKYYIHADHLEARDELLTIGSSRWDDLVDAMSYAEQILTPVFYEGAQVQIDQREMALNRGDSGYGEEY
jgi:hypothetical protein